MIKYNLKKILLEKIGQYPYYKGDELGLVDTSFFSKYDEVPDYNPQDVSPEWREYHADMKDHVVNILDRHLYTKYDEPAGTWGGSTVVDDFLSDFENHPDLSQKMNDHIKNSRARTWIEAFDHWNATDDDIGISLSLDNHPGRRHND